GPVAAVQGGERVDDGVDAGLAAGADVDRARIGAAQRGEVGGDHVEHVDEVAGLLAVAADDGRLRGEQAGAGDRHHAGLAAAVLAGGGDVAVAQGGGGCGAVGGAAGRRGGVLG